MMSLFHFKKTENKEPACNCGNTQEQIPTCTCSSTQEQTSACSCATTANQSEEAATCDCGGKCQTAKIKIKILGTGCAKCHEQLKNVQETIKAMGLDTEVEYITDLQTIMTYGVMSMPAVVINEKVVSMGKVLKPSEVEKLLKKVL